MRSWDFFDTLCGRRTGHEPWRLFDYVAGEEYRRLRQAAELASDKTWHGIFKSLRSITGWTADRIADLQAREWAAETAAAFPIAENVSRLQPSDIIVSDCYFTTEQVRELADIIGVPRSVEIVTSWDGKYSGRWWKTDAAKAAEIHVGDNPRSDVAQPKAAGLQADRYIGCLPTQAEKELEKSGRWQVAAAMRASRLQASCQPGTAEHGWWQCASQANVRFLILAASAVRQYVEAARPKRVYFVSRDTLILQEACRRALDLEVGTFWASRETLRRPSKSFLAYAKSIAPGSLFVDLHGSGRTVEEFASQSGVNLAYVFVCGQRALPAVRPRLVELRGIGTGTAVEVMNYDMFGRVIDVVDGQPVRASVEYDTAAVAVHRQASLRGVEACMEYPRDVRQDELVRAAEAIRVGLDRALLKQHQVHHPETVSTETVAPGLRRRIRR